MNTIFVAIAAYRDPELLPTLKNCLSQAAFPERVHFGIVWQHADEDSWDTIEEYRYNPNFKIVDVDYRASKGVCWARHEMQKLYNGETYYLQLDSHHRFDKHWDIKLVTMLQGLQEQGYPKPLITAYATAYDPGTEERSEEPWKLNFDRFAPDGVVHFTPGGIPDYQTLSGPIPSRFLSAHFIFTLGQFCTEIPYDPEYYFHGEEISLAVRAFTHGYDLFHPHKVIIWHEYIRKNKAKHWADNNWSDIDKRAKEKNRQLLGVDSDPIHIETYGLGTTRSLRDYEMYAGIEFKTRRIHKHTVEEKNPPVPLEDFESQLAGYKKYCIDIYKESVREPDYDFWVVVFKDSEGNEIHREDASEEEIQRIMNEDQDNLFAQVWRKFYSNIEATHWLIWPHSRSKEWCDIIEGTL